MNFHYNQLVSQDIAVLKTLLEVFAEAFNESHTYQSNIPTDKYLKSFLAKPHVIAVVAKDGDKVIGGLIAYELEKFEQERREIYIYDLAVLASYRRKGVATALINHLRTIAQKHNAYVIFVQADKEDTPAIKLYESLGAKKDVYHFDIAVN